MQKLCHLNEVFPCSKTGNKLQLSRSYPYALCINMRTVQRCHRGLAAGALLPRQQQTPSRCQGLALRMQALPSQPLHAVLLVCIAGSQQLALLCVQRGLQRAQLSVLLLLLFINRLLRQDGVLGVGRAMPGRRTAACSAVLRRHACKLGPPDLHATAGLDAERPACEAAW